MIIFVNPHPLRVDGAFIKHVLVRGVVLNNELEVIPPGCTVVTTAIMVKTHLVTRFLM